jgi:hypothetical protein
MKLTRRKDLLDLGFHVELDALLLHGLLSAWRGL